MSTVSVSWYMYVTVCPNAGILTLVLVIIGVYIVHAILAVHRLMTNIKSRMQSNQGAFKRGACSLIRGH